MPDLDRLDRVLEEFPDGAGEGRGRRRGLFGRRSRSEEAFWDGEPDARDDDPDPPRGRGRAGRRGRADDAGPRDRDRPAGPGEHPDGRRPGSHSGSRSARPAGPADAEPTLPPRRSRGQDGAPPVPRDPRAQPGSAGSAAGPRLPQGEPDPAAAHTGPLPGRRGDLGRPAAPGGPGPMVRPAELGDGGPRDDPGDSNQRLRGRRHRALADPAPDGAVPERAAAPWADEPVGSRRRSAAPGAAASARGGPRLRYKTTVQMQPGPGTSPGTGPLGSIRTYQPGTGPQVAVDDSASFWAGTGPGPAIETGPRRVSADQPTAAPDTDGRGRKRRSASAAGAQPPPAGTRPPREPAVDGPPSGPPGQPSRCGPGLPTRPRPSQPSRCGRAAGPASAGPAG